MQWVVVVVIIVVAVVSAVAQTIKNQKDKEPPPPRRRPNRSNTGDGVKTGSSDMDRFLQEIEKLRKRTADGGEEPKKSQKNNRGPKAVPTVAPVKRSRRSDPIPSVAPPQRIDRLPAATVLPPPTPPADEPSPITQSAPNPTDAPSVTRASRPTPASPFAKNLLAMLGNKQSLPLAVVLQEILGPPKCQQAASPRTPPGSN